MDTYTLTREPSTPQGTFGQMFSPAGEHLADTVERPWDDNKNLTSCIPQGTYLCIPHSGPEFKNVWEITGVPGREAILIHNGNTMLDVKGCVAVGTGRGKVKGLPAVMNSVVTLDELRHALPDRFMLIVQAAA